MALTTRSPMEAVRRFLAVFEDGNLELMRDLCDPDVRWLDERTGDWQSGVESLIESTRSAMEGASAMRAELRDAATIDAGDHAVVSGLLLYQATWDGQSYEIPCPTTFVLRRDGETWRVVYQHAMEYRPRTAD